MTSFILKLFFSGLMAFVPNQDGTEVTVLLLNVSHDYQLSDSSTLPHHMPLLLSRAGSCSGDCPTRDADIAQFLFEDKTQAEALDSLETAVSGGGAWALDGSDLSVQKGNANAADLPALVIRNDARGSSNGQPLTIPTSATEREDYSWLVSLHTVCPLCTFNSDVLAAQPPAIVAARFHIRSGKVFTYAIARIGSNVTPVHFQRLDGTGSTSSYSQAIATWMGTEIQVTGDDIEIVEDKFDGTAGRTMTLAPDADGKVEIAVLNMPPFTPPATPFTGTPDPGKHFELYYDLTQMPPAQDARLVPKPGAAPDAPSYEQVDWGTIHPQDTLWSDLLNALRLNIGREQYNAAICPATNWP